MMSKDFGSVHDSTPKGFGEIVWKGICISCNREWSMTESEKNWWDAKIRNEGATFPRRCRECREKKRGTGTFQKSPPSKGSILVSKLKDMVTNAINDYYDDRGDFLAQELTDLIDILENPNES